MGTHQRERALRARSIASGAAYCGELLLSGPPFEILAQISEIEYQCHDRRSCRRSRVSGGHHSNIGGVLRTRTAQKEHNDEIEQRVDEA